MSDFQFVFLAALLCNIAQGLYSHIIRSKSEASAGMRRIAVYACIAFDLGVAWGGGGVNFASSLEERGQCKSS